MNAAIRGITQAVLLGASALPFAVVVPGAVRAATAAEPVAPVRPLHVSADLVEALVAASPATAALRPVALAPAPPLRLLPAGAAGHEPCPLRHFRPAASDACRDVRVVVPDVLRTEGEDR